MIIKFITVYILLVALDFVWISFVANKKYKKELGHMLMTDESGKMKVRYLPTAILYVFLTILIMLTTLPFFEFGINFVNTGYAFMMGVLLYGFYEFTNWAILKDWPRGVILVDVLWGGVIVSVASVVASLIVF